MNAIEKKMENSTRILLRDIIWQLLSPVPDGEWTELKERVGLPYTAESVCAVRRKGAEVQVECGGNIRNTGEIRTPDLFKVMKSLYETLDNEEAQL